MPSVVIHPPLKTSTQRNNNGPKKTPQRSLPNTNNGQLKSLYGRYLLPIVETTGSSIRHLWQYLAASKAGRCLVRLGHMTLTMERAIFTRTFRGCTDLS